MPEEGHYNCIKCDPGLYCAREGLSAVSGPGKAGHYVKTGSPFNDPTSSQSSTLEFGDLCNVGFYCPEGSAYEKKCSPGKYCDRRGLSEPSGLCSEGYYCRSGAITQRPKSLAN